MGTSSHAGKSVLAAAFGCWLQQKGLRVAPFKAQNMSLNSFVTLAGEEVARSQSAQAAVLGLEVTADMNPVLLKPLDAGCQVVIQGKAVGNMSIHEFYGYKPNAWRAITESYQRLASTYDAVVLEGAGSAVEINLRDHDLVNMRMAAHASAAVVIVADIERGGVFAQLVGTWELLSPAERARVVGFVINKMRGDASLLRSGLELIQQRTGRPVLGVLPFDLGIQLEEEDSLGLADSEGTTGDVDVAVLRLPGISNFTDFSSLVRAPGVTVRYVSGPGLLGWPDLVVLPGTRTTVRALAWLRANGLADAVGRLAAAPNGPLVLGLCGGFQILGRSITDPDQVESPVPRVEGLGLLEVDTRFESRKLLSRVEGVVIADDLLGYDCPVVGYEIHQGQSLLKDEARPWLRLRRQTGEEIEDGAARPDGRVYGTYVHGLFDDARFSRTLVATLRQRRGLAPLDERQWQVPVLDPLAGRLVRWLEGHCDLRAVATAVRV
jgi:adenosylcobyric acid synthase